MAAFHFEALTMQGDEVVDSVEADSSQEAREKLSQRGLFVTKLEQVATADNAVRASSSTSYQHPKRHRSSPTPEMQARHARDRRTAGIGFIVMGSAVLLFGVWMAIDAVPFVISAEQTTGLCTGQAYNSSDNEYNIPIIEFTVDGTTHRVESRGILGMQFVSGYRKGMRMTVLYPPGHPEEARGGGVIGNLQFPLVFLFAGVLFAGSGAWLMSFKPK